MSEQEELLQNFILKQRASTLKQMAVFLQFLQVCAVIIIAFKTVT